MLITNNNFCNNAKLFVYSMRTRAKFPTDFDYYGDLKVTKIASQTIEDYMKSINIDPDKHFLSDNEHYNTEFHKYIKCCGQSHSRFVHL